MRNILTIVFVFGFIASFSQDIDTVLKKHYEAMGSEKLSKIKTISLNMSMTVMGQTTFMKMRLKNPDKIYAEMQVMGEEVLMVVNGENAIMKMGDQVMPMDEKQKQELVGQLNLEGDLYNYKEKGHQISLRGEGVADGKKYYLIDALLKDKENTPMVMFINTETYLIDKMEVTVNENGQEMTMTLTIDEYFVQDGITIVSKISSVYEGMNIMDITLSDVVYGAELDDNLFIIE
ncbi:MAG: hypothetical protein ABFS32_17735 [Bacteroidota bacterium]